MVGAIPIQVFQLLIYINILWPCVQQREGEERGLELGLVFDPHNKGGWEWEQRGLTLRGPGDCATVLQLWFPCPKLLTPSATAPVSCQ